MSFVFFDQARWRVRLVAVALSCAWPMAAPGAAELPSAEPLDWRQANEAVGRYLRGHTDLLKAESAPAPAAPDVRAELRLDAALAQALARRPDLFERPGQSPTETAQQRLAALEWQRDVREAWGQAVLAEQLARLSEEAAHVTATGAELGRRMAQVGTWSRAQWLHEHTLSLDAQMARDNALAAAAVARAKLWQRLGVADGDTRWRLPDQWPAPAPLPTPAAASAHGTAPQPLFDQALAQRPELMASRLEAQRLTQAVTPEQLGTARAHLATAAQAAVSQGQATAGLNPVALGWSHAQERALGASLAVHAQEATLRLDLQNAWRQWQMAQSQVTRLSAWQAAQTELLDDMQRRYNGMLKSTWDLLASAREHMAMQQRLQQARHDLWLSHTRLQHLLAGGDAAPHSPSLGAVPTGGAQRSPGH